MLREGSASSSPTIRKLCFRPSLLRRVTVMPKDARLWSVRARRLPRSRAAPASNGFPVSGSGSRSVASFRLRPGAPPRSGREPPRSPRGLLSSPSFDEGIGDDRADRRPCLPGVLNESATDGGYRCRTGCPLRLECVDAFGGFRLRIGFAGGLRRRRRSCLSSHNSGRAFPGCSGNKRPSSRRVPPLPIFSRFACALRSPNRAFGEIRQLACDLAQEHRELGARQAKQFGLRNHSHFFLHSFRPRPPRPS